ncbi:hypothetical protein V8G54_002569 [Vigna mungo]|uniref:Tf2-1-like SH3-like domain-containing protein n=1 Tax=Vigna mungo TaxID=3915 RepID=A0AAQ3PAF1_VIGMU
MDTSKLNSIRDWPQPKNLKQLHGFLGLSGQHSLALRKVQKLSMRYFGPFEVLAKIGNVGAGLKLIKIFKEDTSKTCFLDIFDFTRPVWEGKHTDEKVEINGEANIHKYESKLLKESNLTKKDGDDPKVVENGYV